jgi:hypothetical protein
MQYLGWPPGSNPGAATSLDDCVGAVSADEPGWGCGMYDALKEAMQGVPDVWVGSCWVPVRTQNGGYDGNMTDLWVVRWYKG